MKLFLLLTTLASCQAASVFVIDDQDHQVLQHVERMKRYSEETIHGHTIGVLHAEDPDTGIIHGLTKRDVLNHVAHPSSSHRQFRLDLQTGHSVHMALARRNVVTASTNIIERREDDQVEFHDAPVDCFFAGPTRDTIGHAALSLCDGELMGSVHAAKRLYEIHELPSEVAERHRRSTDLNHVLVTWSDPDASEESHNINRPSVDDTVDVSLLNDFDFPSFERERRSLVYGSKNYVHTNRKIERSRESRTVIVESAAFLDQDFNERLTQKYGFKDSRKVVRVALLKYCGIASVYSDPKFGWNLTFRLVHLEVFQKNPEWYLPEAIRAETRMGLRLNTICKHTKRDLYDHVLLWTQNCEHKNFIGFAYINGACSRARCCVTRNVNFRFSVELHEIGHSLGLRHEWNMAPCEHSTDHAGFMAGQVSYAPKCYQDEIDRALQRRSCLYWEAFTTEADENITNITPGMKLGFDGQCQLKYGDEFRYMHSADVDICGRLYCVGSDPSKLTYGVMKSSPAVRGTPCAHDRFCTYTSCPPIEDTSYPAVLTSHERIHGGWGNWSDYSQCGSEEGLTSLRVATRQCNNPEPNLGNYCEGDMYKAEVCKVTKNKSGMSELELATQRVCKYHHDHDPYGSESKQYHSFHGSLYDSTGSINTCAIKCMRRKKLGKITYVLPDGVPCTDVGPNVDDIMKGIERRCVNGVCMAFGCNGKTLGEGGGLVLDECGVCGGSGDTCQHGEFNDYLERGLRRVVVKLPAGATNIYVGHPKYLQRHTDLEIRTKDVPNGQSVVSKADGTGKLDLDYPTSYANTYWYFDEKAQSVTAAGPTDQPVLIWIYQSWSSGNYRAFYRYTKPTEDYLKPVNCRNGGVSFSGGCQCRFGFYGLRCEHKCSTICRGGAPLDVESCTCQCNPRQEGKECQCKNDYKGESCNQCKRECKNGGKINLDKCTCSCPVNCDGSDCSDLCQNKTPGHCPWWNKCWKSDRYLQNCRLRCHQCKFDKNVNGGQCLRL